MTEPVTPELQAPATDADGMLLLSAEEAHALLRECFSQFQSGMLDVARTSIELSNDLFEGNEFVSDGDVLDFRDKREEWVRRFGDALRKLCDSRLAGTRRKGRRPDADRSVASLRVLNEFDHEKQAALTAAKSLLERFTKREMDALDLRVGVLFSEALTREVDNPFAPEYLLDAIGMTSRALFPNPRVWRPLMERILADMTPAVTKTYIRLNRLLADRHVLPEIKALLRARSELRPLEDSELLPLFSRLMNELGPREGGPVALGIDIAVPASFAPEALPATPDPSTLAAAHPGPAPAATTVAAPAAAPAPASTAAAGTSAYGQGPIPGGYAMPVQGLPVVLNPYLTAVRDAPLPAMSDHVPVDTLGFPQLDPLLALGTLSAAIAMLDRWQQIDPGADPIGAVSEHGPDLSAMPINRIPYIRAAIADKVANSTDRITMDVIGLLFDYIFRDPSIAESLRKLFARLQVPVLKAALLDRSFFSDKKHPTRRLLDHLAAAAIGATGDEGYRVGLELVAAGVVDEVCRDFKVDSAVFDSADAKLQAFVEGEQTKNTAVLERDVATALAAEQGDVDRSQVRVLIRDKLAGVDAPFDVRSFTETIWADYLTVIRKRDGTGSEAWRAAVQTVDDLMWSITTKERTAQKARLTKMVPALIRSLRAGGIAIQVPADRMQPFLEALYALHMAAIKPEAAAATGGDAATAASIVANAAGAGQGEPVTQTQTMPQTITNVHDFVNEMVVGTWLVFAQAGATVNARLSWISPLRTKYIFTNRSRAGALVVTPEELAWQLGAGTARLLVEPVPLFDRAVSAALDSLSAQKRAQDAAAAA